ncbi:MAG: hypothetical protein U0L72_04065 [Acutalibacteraceae bacterium]|nr:hypothetical protein [Acutalibacteraceae bacterium]
MESNLKDIKTQTKLGLLEMALIIFISAYYILPSVSNNFPQVFILFVFMAYTVYICFKQLKESAYIIACFLIIAFIALMYTVLTDTDSISANATNYELKSFYSKLLQYFYMFFPAFLTFRIANSADLKQKKLLLTIITIMIVLVIILTIRELAINPNITRSWKDFDESSKNNVASYTFVYAIPIFISILVISFNKSNNGYIKLLIVLLGILSFVFLLRAQYTLALLIAVIGLLAGFIKTTKSSWLKLISIITVAIMLVFSGDILSFMASKVNSSQISLRLRELSDFFTSGDASGYNLGSRFNLYWRSILAFFASPIWGNRSLDFDGHATFLTVLSDTGILGGIPFYYLYFSMRKRIINVICDYNKFFNVSFFMLVLMGLTNPIHAAFPVGFTVWFVVPLIIMIINNNSDLRGA